MNHLRITLSALVKTASLSTPGESRRIIQVHQSRCVCLPAHTTFNQFQYNRVPVNTNEMSSKITITLPTGQKMPALGFGTWQVR